jgi:hypothetical protein
VTLDELVNTQAWQEALDDPYFKGLVWEALDYEEHDMLNAEAMAGMLNAAWALGNIRANQDVAIRQMQATTHRRRL